MLIRTLKRLLHKVAAMCAALADCTDLQWIGEFLQRYLILWHLR